MKYIKIWPFYDAPKKYRELSNNGGDEDWLALVPAHISDEWCSEYGRPIWLDVPAFGCCCVDDRIKDGVVYIGCHA